jgi:hypothetical protein
MMSSFRILSLVFMTTIACQTIVQAGDEAPRREKSPETKPRVEKPDGGKSPKINHPALRAMEGAKLSDEQKSKVKAITEEFTEKMTALREKGHTPALTKKRAEAMKKARQAGKKGKELRSEVIASIDASDQEKELLRRGDEVTAKLHQELATVLTDEQIDALPPQVKRPLRAAKDRAAGKTGKKKNAA